MVNSNNSGWSKISKSKHDKGSFFIAFFFSLEFSENEKER